MYQRFSTSRDARAERAVTEVLGAILVFGLVLAVLALVQVSAIPAANEQVEFEHSQRVAGDFQMLDTNIDSAGTRGSLGTTGVEAGVRYPNRLFFINPGPVGGSLLSDSGSVQLNGLTGTTGDEAADYDLTAAPFETTGLEYSATYNQYAEAPTVHYENGVLFERYENLDGTVEDIVIDGGSLVSGRRITIITVEGDFSTQVPDELAVNVVPVSTGTKAVTVNAGNNARISIETTLSENTWNEILAAELATGRVEAVACPRQGNPDLPCDGTLNIDIQNGIYDLRMAKVGLTTNDNQNPAADFGEEDARYIVAETSTSTSAVTGQQVRLVAEVRDRFNNPVSGEEVNFQLTGSGGSFDSEPAPETNIDGLVSVLVATSGNGPITVEASIDGSNAPEKAVTFDITLVDTGDDDNGGGPDEDTLSTINDADAPVFISNVELKNTVDPPQQGEDSGLPDTFRVTMENRDTVTQTVDQARLSFLLSEEDALFVEVIDRTNGDTLIGRLYLTDSFAPIGPIVLAPGEVRVVDLVFYEYADPADVPGNADIETNLVGQNDKSDTFATFSMIVTTEVVGPDPDETTRQTAFVAVSNAEPVAFLSVDASDINENSAGQDQTFTFELARGLNPGETVRIDLSDVDGAVNYGAATVSDNSGFGTASYDSGTDDLVFEATGSGVAGGQTVTITVSDLNVGNTPGNNYSAQVEFTRSDVPTAPDEFTATFNVN